MTDKLIKAINKELFVSALKVGIRNNNSEPMATYLCNQLDDAKKLADFLEEYVKLLRNQAL